MGNGIEVESWAKVEGHCAIECDVVGDEVQMRLGDRSSGLDLIFTEEGLENMVDKCSGALREIRACDEESVCQSTR